MKKITQNLRWLVTLLTMIVSVDAWAQSYEWVETDPSALVTGDIVVIVDKTSQRAMTNNSNPPAAKLVAVNNGKLNGTVDNILQWEVTVDDGSYQFNVPGTENYLYYTATNNGVKVGNNDYNTFTIVQDEGNNKANFLKGVDSKGDDRYIGVYIEQDWRCYTSINANIKNTVTAFYKRVVSDAPSITLSTNAINVTAAGGDGTVEVTCSEFEPESIDLEFCKSDGTPLEDGPEWVGAEINTQTGNVDYLIEENDGEARSAYFKVVGYIDEETDPVYSELITINQAAFVLDYATLPFAYDGGRNAINTDIAGLSQEGLDTDYSSSPKLKFNGSGDWVILKINESPGTLSFDIKGNSFSGGTFKVQTSVDGTIYTDLKTYTELDDVQNESINNLGENVRYIKWIYTTKASGNVALGNIKLEKPSTAPQITVADATIDVDANEHEGTLALSYENLSISEMTDFGIQFYDANNQELTTEPDWVEVLVAEEEGGESYVVSYYMLANEGDARTAYCKVFAMGDEDFVYSNLITINQAAYVAPPTPVTDVVYTKVTSTDDITNGQYLIVYEVNEEGGVAFNGGLTTLDASGNTIDVTIENGTIAGTDVTEAAEFTINVTEGSLKSASGYYIGVSSNSNGLKQTEDATTYTNTFSIDNDENAVIAADFTGSNMKLLFNNSGRFRYYSSINQTNKAIQLYKKVVETAPSVTIGASKWATYVAEDNVTFPTGVSAYTVETINTDHVTLGVVSAVKEGTPILVYSETPGTYSLELVNKNNCSDTSTNQLKAGPKTGDGATIYALANQDGVVGFYPVSSTITVPAGKAYLEIPPTMSVKGFLALGGLADAINNIAVENANGTIFNIAGQKVQNITKGGLYIVNGKKVVVK